MLKTTDRELIEAGRQASRKYAIFESTRIYIDRMLTHHYRPTDAAEGTLTARGIIEELIRKCHKSITALESSV